MLSIHIASNFEITHKVLNEWSTDEIVFSFNLLIYKEIKIYFNYNNNQCKALLFQKSTTKTIFLPEMIAKSFQATVCILRLSFDLVMY